MEDQNFSYKDISEHSDATYDYHQESVEPNDDADGLDDYDVLLQTTMKKVPILSDFDQSEAGTSTTSKAERADEFLRNFFTKFMMKKTSD